MKMEIRQLREEAIEAIRQFHSKYPDHKESEVDDIANDMNFTGNLIMSSKTETNKTETE